ncbi:MAG TPA: PQQ-dependent sugar dehydrogenase [Gemmatimonadales bacterium]|jgi:glucose/arabinose dehydrogenase|nr:PQQ-dependent sugar dehydrogenase [Gemmatimonadales bacterium]
MRAATSVILIAIACKSPAPAAGQDHTLRVPPGFKIAVFADSLEGVRYLALGPGNAIYASQPGRGVVVQLTDNNHDGIADGVVTVASGLRGPFGIAFRGDTMYVAEERDVKRFDPGARSSNTVIDDIPGGGHSTRTILFGPDGKLYLAVGSSCNLCDERDSLRAAVSQFNPDGSGGRVFARGLRNTVGLAFNPKTGELWGGNNDRDNLGDDLPPEHVNIIKAGRNYGWPNCYLPGKPNPEYGSADCSNVEPPAITIQAHSAPLGIAFYSGAQFPADYRGDAFVTLHGSWNRSVPTGAKVVRIQVDTDGRRATGVDDFITGWQLPDGSRWGRPVGLLVLPDGSLLVSDDMGGKIWRVSYGR